MQAGPGSVTPNDTASSFLFTVSGREGAGWPKCIFYTMQSLFQVSVSNSCFISGENLFWIFLFDVVINRRSYLLYLHMLYLGIVNSSSPSLSFFEFHM